MTRYALTLKSQEDRLRAIKYIESAPWGTVFTAHLLHNYDECNNPDSILHMLIPRGKDGFNEQCAMFYEDVGKPHPDQLNLTDAISGAW